MGILILTRIVQFFILLAFTFSISSVHANENYDVESFNDTVFKIPIKIKQLSKDKPHTMVLVHGMGTRGSSAWDQISKELAKKYHILTFDLPGFGESQGKLGVKANPENYASLIMRIVSGYAKSKVIFVGHSMGASVGLRFVSQYPQLVDKVVLMNAAGILEKAAYLKFLTRMSKDNKFKAFFAGLSNIVMDIAVEVFDRFTSIEIMKTVMDKDADANIAINLIQTDFTEDIKSIRSNVLIIWGQKDAVAPVRTGQMLNYHLEKSKLVVIPDAGHIPLIKKTKEVSRLLLDWIENPTSEQIRFTEPADRKFDCDNKELKEPLSGSYGALIFEDCSNIQLKNLGAKSLKFIDSVATLENVKVVSHTVGIQADESTVMATNLVIEAPVGIHSDGSKFDIAGAIIKHQSRAIRGTNSLIYWSTSFHTENEKPTRAIHQKQILK